MMHSDADALAAMAMGETDVAADDLMHVESCEDCAREIRSLRRIADLARTGPAEEPLLSPDPSVWSRISSTLELSGDVVPDTVRSQLAQDVAPVADIRRPRRTRPTGRTRSPRRLALPLAIAASIVLIAGVGGAVVLAQRPTATVLADVALKPLPDWTGSTGDARIEKATNGQRDVVVRLSGSTSSSSGYREVWLISSDLTKLVSVGVLTGDEGSFEIPAGVDLSEYPIVDISQENVDGNPAHSGDSIVRGEITS